MDKPSNGMEAGERTARISMAAEIQLTGDKRFNQILIMAGGGGAGSGKSFLLKNYIGT